MAKKKQKKVMFIASTGGHLSELLQSRDYNQIRYNFLPN